MSSVCFCKILMHSLKYPFSTVCGLLLSDKRKKESNCVTISDCIPLYHTTHGLTVNIEIALHLISGFCKDNNLSLVGYYQANKHFYDSTPDVFAQKIADKLLEVNGDSYLVMVNNFGLPSAVCDQNNIENALLLYQCVDGKWKSKSGIVYENPTATLSCIQQLIYQKQLHFNLVDFDNHLDDVTNDWRNQHINELINEIIAVK
ncbi:COX4 neighbor-like protein [Dinothrombium tinctorium]|uniref:COX4 neighbor-like protein n=1 Tax=Dinothrombium tinctorium TaxID=1965070 RepID=A0A3S3PRP1_9ACAR|nr:COX4 neighbor-like protein [Dinothrombium tinctorium]RWS15194.1 COX4 neighbor-like protein [Dinothrombium tinctorium]RWS15207.1 COX4 neighbor-like protein [Dinothrombium tinctorium]